MKRYITEYNPDLTDLQEIVETITRNGIPGDAKTIYKGRNTVYTIKHGDGEINIKAFHCPNFLNAYIYATLRKSKAFRSFKNAQHLRELGFLSPSPIGYGEELDGIKLLHSYYFSEQLPSQNMRDWTEKPDCEPLLRAFAKEIARLHRAGVWHKDFSPGNILYTGNSSEGYKFYYIDLNRMQFGVSDRKKLMSMFRAINLDPKETERIARYYAEASGQNADLIAREALEQLKGYFRQRNRKKWLKKLFKRKK